MFGATAFPATLLGLAAVTNAGPMLHAQRDEDNSKSKTTDLPLTWTPFGFVTDVVSIGTPPQKVPSFVDWTWIGQYAFTTLCNDSPDATYDCLAKDQIIYNQSQSSTFVNQSNLYPERNWNPNHFFFYKDLKVEYGSDVEHVGDVEGRITVMAADMDFNLGFTYPFAGVFGLSPVFDADNASTASPFHQLWKSSALTSPIVAFHYCYNDSLSDTQKTTCNGHDGLQTLGGYNPKLVKDSKITWYDNIVFPAVNVIDFVYTPELLNYWAINLTSLKIGGETQALNESAGSAAVFDHASYGRGAPLSTNAYNNLINITAGKPITLDPKTQAPNNGNQSFVSVDCAKIAEFPVLKYQFGKDTPEWEIESRNYVEKVDVNGTETCVLNVRTLGEGDYQIGNFGETFAKDKYVLFDFEKLKVGLADLQW